MTKRTDRIIHILLLRPNGMTIHELSENLNVSDRTIRNEINTINSLLRQRGLSNIYQNRGFIQLSQSKEDLLKIKELRLSGDDADYYTPKERFVIILFDILTAHQPIFVYQEQDKLKVSKSTIDEDMRILRKFLKQYALQVITSVKDGIYIQGSERLIRTMLVDVITQYSDLSRLINLDTSYQETIVQSIQNFIPNSLVKQVRLTYINKVHDVGANGNIANDYQLILHSCVWVRRLLTNDQLVAESHDNWQPDEGKIKAYILQVVQDFELKQVADDEFRYIYFVLNSFNSNFANTASGWIETQLLTTQLVTYMEERLELPFSSQEDLYEGLYSHLTSLVYRVHEQIQSYNPLKSIIKSNYADIYQSVFKFMTAYFQEQTVTISDDEICYITVYFGTAKMQIERDQTMKYRVAVICNYGLATGHLLAAELERKFNIEVLAVLSMADIQVLSKLSIDFVVKTIQVDTGHIPSVKLPPIPQESDYLVLKDYLTKTKVAKRASQINSTNLFDDVLACVADSYQHIDVGLIKSLSTVFKKHHLIVNEKEVQPMLADLLTDDRIQLRQSVTDWKEAIQLAAQPLIEDQVINEQYVHAMLESVVKFGPYIVIGPGLALAHARPEDGAKKLGVSVLTLSTPVKFGNKDNDPVSLVFCLSAINNYSHLNVMKAIVRLVADPDKIAALSQIEKLETFKEALFQQELQRK
ncbi:BglG family transcription antiterminator [Lactiplantibacillus mudanjiangensis]|uniref:PTS system, IIA component [Lactobacillus rhamnosus Lc 705] n=1 Tax=Lactiplantibacillus mudanjiangensis TaxID=1296538 RepID=A0A660E8F8_9LACO|nr:PTS sugar transporter subunit IIA [Lactiplantibacillus mudanjiangensis]VDG26319.1 PTS system, IIA component [Lactobacillus rhamnosus Lc 705] [Lactiplantibacillus mudanjiangensis]VDG29407.1 PTS system, IIA component [Lactobacillus rhamnosus Lc 705] [Lactiplantibacillus mudanjiangensis]